MKRLLFIITLVLLFFFSLSKAQATIVRPDGDVAINWQTTGTSHYTEITSANDIVTQPTTPDTSDYVYDGSKASERYSMDNSITDVNTVTAIDFWIYAYSTKGGDLTLSLYWDGSLQTSTVVSVNNANNWTGAGWTSASTTGLSLTQSQLDSLELELSGGQGGRTYYVAALYADVTYTPTASVAVSITTDGSVAFGYQALDSTVDTTTSGVETISVDSGPADLDVRSSSFSDGSNTWGLSTVNGADQVHWEFSKDGTSWSSFAIADNLYTFDTNVSQGATRDIYFRLTMPTSTSSYNQHSSTVTVVASAP